MSSNTENQPQLSFRDYYNGLSDKEKENIIFHFVPKYMSTSTFYYRMRNESWLEYDYEKMQELTQINFRPCQQN